MLNGCRIDSKADLGKGFSAPRGFGQARGHIEQLLFSQPYEGTAQQRSQRKRISRIRQRAHEGNEVLYLLPVVKILPGLRAEGKLRFLERLLVAPKFSTDRCEQRDIPRR